MPEILVPTIQDPRLRPYRDLTSSSSAREMGLFISEGRSLLQLLLASDYRIHSVLVERQYLATVKHHVGPDTPLYVVEDGNVENLVGFNFHRGVLACGYRRASPRLEDALRAKDRLPSVVVICVGVQDPENLGGILRNCAAFGVEAVILGPNCTDPYSRRVLRVSMGAAWRLLVIESNDLACDLDCLKNRLGFQINATVLGDQAQLLGTTSRPQRLGLLFGNEAHGLESQWLVRCDRRVTLPMQGGTDSLNVAVATGIFLYHFTRVAAIEEEERRI